MDGRATVVPRHELMNVRAVTQLEKDTILVCYDSKFRSFKSSLQLSKTCEIIQLILLSQIS